MKKVYGYIRVSTQKQGDGVSLIEQKSAIATFAKRKNLQIVRWFEEKQTAAKQGRPEFNEMLALLDEDEASGAVFHKVNRSTRNFGDWHMLSMLADKGVSFYSAIDGIDIFEDSRRMLSDIEVVMAAGYIRDLKKEVKKGFYGRLKQGYYPMQAPIGYKDMGGGRKKTIDPIMGPLVQQVYELYCTRKYGFHDLVKEMHLRGLRNKWGSKVSKSGIAKILGNTFYYGLIRINKTGETFEGNHAPLIDRVLFDKAQLVRDRKSGRKIFKHDFPYRRAVRCAHCNYALIGELQKGNVYYRCHTKTCPTKTVRQASVHGMVSSFMSDVSLNDYQVNLLEHEILNLLHNDNSTDQSVLGELKLTLGSLNDRLDRLADAVVDLVIDKETYSRKKEVLLNDKLDLQNKIADTEGRNDGRDTKLDKFLELLKTLTVQGKRPDSVDLADLMNFATSNLHYDGKCLRFTSLLPFGLIAKSKKLDSCEPCNARHRTTCQGHKKTTEEVVLQYHVNEKRKSEKNHPVDIPKLAKDLFKAI